MAIGGTQFIQIVIPIKNIRDFDGFLKKNNDNIGILRLYDKYNYLSPWVMDESIIEKELEFWESTGITLKESINGVTAWKDLCVLPITREIAAPDWLVIDSVKRTVAFEEDRSQKTVYAFLDRFEHLMSCFVMGKYNARKAPVKGIVTIDDFSFCYNINPEGLFNIPIWKRDFAKLSSAGKYHSLTLWDFGSDEQKLEYPFELSDGMNAIFIVDGIDKTAKVQYEKMALIT